MLNKRHNSVITLSILLTLVGLSKPAKAFLLAQADAVETTFTVPEELPENTKVGISASNSTSVINQGLKDGFAAKYPNAEVNVEIQSSADALDALLEGKTDLVSIGRNLTTAEKRKGLVTVPISREKIAIVISKNNSYDGNLTFEQFAKIFRGEITDWSDIGGEPGAIQLVDLPDSNDTRQAFPNYSVFQAGEFTTGSNTTKVDEDSADAMISQLGTNGISYAVAGDVIDRDDVKVVTMHKTLPDDPRYPFSQPFSLVYQGTPSEAASAFLGFATTEEGQKTLAQRVGSLSVVNATAIAPGLENADADTTDVDKATQTDADTADADKVAQADADDSSKLNPDVEDSGKPNANTEDSGKINADLDGSGEIDANLDGSGDLDVDKVKGSGELNPELEGSGELNPDVKDSGTPNANLGADSNANGNADANANTDADTIANSTTEVDEDKGTAVATQKKWWWWLPLIIGIPLLGALAYKFIGGKKKSDQEPAIADIDNSDISQGDDDFDPNLDNGDTKVGASIGNVATETANKGSKIGGAAIATGGAAIAGGAAAINKIGGINKSEKDVDIDSDIELEDFAAQPEVDIDTSINEIPSNPVNEFVGQETTLQSTEQSTKLQVDDFESDDSGLVDNISTIGEVAAAGGATAATGFLGNKDTVEDEIDTFKIDSEASAQSDFVSEQSTTLQGNNVEEQTYTEITTDSSEDLDNLESNASSKNSEFVGDYVLDEENQNTELDNEDSVIDEISWVDDIDVNETETTSSAQTFILDEPVVESSDIGSSVVDKALGIVDDTTKTGGATIAGGAAAVGGAAAAASGFFTKDNQDETTEIDTFGSNDTNIEAELVEDTDNIETTSSAPAFVLETLEAIPPDSQNTKIDEELDLASFVDEDTTEIDIENINLGDNNWVDENNTNETTSSVQAFVLETPDVISTDDQDTVIDQTSGFIDNATQVGGAAAIGGAAAAASGFFSNRDSEQTTEVNEADDINWVDDVNLDFNNDVESLVDNSENSLQEIANSADISLDEITFEDADSITEDTLENITLEETTSSSTLSLDEIAFDDNNDDTVIENRLEDITFDETINSSNTLSLDEIIFDESDDNDSDNNLASNIDVNTLSEQDINLDDLGFETQSTDVSSFMSNQATEIDNMPSNKSSDMNNISEWLDSLETPNKNTENISEWLDNLSADKDDLTSQNTSTDNTIDSENESEDISFQFLEDLLERDTKKND